MPDARWPEHYNELTIGRVCQKLHYPLNDAAFAVAMQRNLIRFPYPSHRVLTPYWPFVLRYTLTKLNKNYDDMMEELNGNPPRLSCFVNADIFPLHVQDVLEDDEDRRRRGSVANTLITDLSQHTFSRIFPRREDRYCFDGAMKLQILSLAEVYTASNGFGVGIPLAARAPAPESLSPQEMLSREGVPDEVIELLKRPHLKRAVARLGLH